MSTNFTTTQNKKTVKNTKIGTKTQKKLKKKQGGALYSDMLIKFRNSFINIDMMVIEEFNELFLDYGEVNICTI